jgi:small subunit ribosomal protein S11
MPPIKKVADAESVKDVAVQETTEKVPVKAKKKNKKAVPRAHVYIQASYNNTIITVTDTQGNVIAWASAGNCGFKGAKKSTPYAAQVATEKAMANAEPYGISEVDVFVKGVGPGRDQSIRGIITKGTITILSIRDITPIPHGGVRHPRPRRV